MKGKGKRKCRKSAKESGKQKRKGREREVKTCSKERDPQYESVRPTPEGTIARGPELRFVATVTTGGRVKCVPAV